MGEFSTFGSPWQNPGYGLDYANEWSHYRNVSIKKFLLLVGSITLISAVWISLSLYLDPRYWIIWDRSMPSSIQRRLWSILHKHFSQKNVLHFIFFFASFANQNTPNLFQRIFSLEFQIGLVTESRQQFKTKVHSNVSILVTNLIWGEWLQFKSSPLARTILFPPKSPTSRV